MLAAMIRAYGGKGYWKSALKLFLHARERIMDVDSKDWEYRYLCYQVALDWVGGRWTIILLGGRKGKSRSVGLCRGGLAAVVVAM